jgi:hypothetical protein
MDKLKLLLVVGVLLISTVIAAAKFVLTELHEFWLFVKCLQW